MPDYELSQDIIDRYNEDGAVLIKGAFTQGTASFTRRVFDVCGCGRKLWCGKLEKLLFLQKHNCLVHLHGENIASLNEA